MSEPAAFYTSLAVDERGVVLYQQHAARMALAGNDSLSLFSAFADRARPGAYSLVADRGGLEIRPRPPSMLADGMPVRFEISPYADEPGPFEKPVPPSRYQPVRLPGIATILTSNDGTEIFESCVASVLAWDGARLLAPPEDRPIVRSAALAALHAAGLLSHAPLLVDSQMPLALINAVAGIRLPAFPGRETFPAQVRAQIEEIFARSSRRGNP